MRLIPLLPVLLIGACLGAEPTTPPNILLIVADDLGWSDVGWHGGFGRTPNMDRLVAQGVQLDRHYVQPLCTPTRAALLSGRYPGRFGTHVLSPSNQQAFPSGTLTVASFLKAHGYATWQAGKWHLGTNPEAGPNRFGFDSSYGSLTGAADPWTHKYRAGALVDTWHRDGRFFHEDGNATELVTAEAINRIEAERAHPWFGYVAFHAVHTPVDAPAEYKRLYDGVHFHDDPLKQDSRLRMAAMVSQLDAKVGDLITALERSGQRERTLVIFTSDNGGIESLKNDYVGTVPDSPLNSENDPLRGQKATLYEGGVRVCAWVNWPGKVTAQVVKSPMHAVDWLPTIATVTGNHLPADLRTDGVDQWPTITTGQPAPARTIYIASSPTSQALYQGDWKLIRKGKQDAVELFNLATDPYEKQDRAKAEPAVVAELTKLLEQQHALDLSKGSSAPVDPNDR